MTNNRAHLFVESFIRLLTIYGLGLVIFFIFRLLFTFEYGDVNELQKNLSEVASAFFIGFRTDTMSISYGLLPVYLVILGILFSSKAKETAYLNFIRKFSITYSSIIFLLFILIMIADFFFYRFFNDRLNILVFALFDDDTGAILTSMWTDYPVLKTTIAILVCSFLLFFLTKKIVTIKLKPFQVSVLMTIPIAILSVVLVFTALRTSWGSSPLRIQNTVVSENTFINKIGLNGVYSLQNAYGDYVNGTINTNISETLKKYKFSSIQEVLEAFLNTEKSKVGLPVALKMKTPLQAHIERRKPNIVFFQMESMSGRLMEFHSSDFNLMGNLEEVLPNCYVFKNFVSSTGSTIHSLEALLIASPETPVSQSIYQERSLSTSAALPYLRAGYNTSFITGSKLAWRNLEGYISKQYFTDVEGNVTLKKYNPMATEGEWGTYDEFLFDRVFQKLETANDSTPQFIFAMTTTNHTPYDLPDTYKPLPLNISTQVDTLLKIEKDVALRNFKTYQYSNDCLGKFMKRILNSKLKDNTIVVAVGDHSLLQLFKATDQQFMKNISVPLIVMIPEAYKPDYEIDQSRFGSHKDIFPTLFRLTLSNGEFINSGNDLFAPPSDSTYYFGVYKYNAGFSKDGCVLVNENLSYTWTDSLRTSLISNQKTKGLKFLDLKTRAYSAAMSCYIKNEFSTKAANTPQH